MCGYRRGSQKKVGLNLEIFNPLFGPLLPGKDLDVRAGQFGLQPFSDNRLESLRV